MDAKAAARAELIREREAGMWTDDDGFAVERPAGDSPAEDGAARDSADHDGDDDSGTGRGPTNGRAAE